MFFVSFYDFQMVNLSNIQNPKLSGITAVYSDSIFPVMSTYKPTVAWQKTDELQMYFQTNQTVKETFQ